MLNLGKVDVIDDNLGSCFPFQKWGVLIIARVVTFFLNLFCHMHVYIWLCINVHTRLFRVRIYEKQMERSRRVVMLMIISLVVCLVAPAAVFGHNVAGVYVFGDSLFDAGNNHYNKNCTAQADFAPYGSSFFHHPTGRFTNGRTVADFICTYDLYMFYLYIHTHIIYSHFSFYLSADHYEFQLLAT